MIGRRSWLPFVLVLLCALALGSYGYFSLQRQLQQYGIDVQQFQGLGLSAQGIDLRALSLAQGDSQLHLQGLHLPWSGLSLDAPYAQQLQIDQLHLQLQAPVNAAEASAPATGLHELLGSLALLPEQLQIQQLQLDLPCPRGRCSLQGDLHLQRQAAGTDQRLAIRLNLTPATGPALNAQLHLNGAAHDTTLQFELAVAGQPQLQLHSQLTQNRQGSQWQGRLSASELSAADALQTWLGQWLPEDLPVLPRAPGAARLSADWQLHLPPGPLDAAMLSQARGRFSASAELPEAWPVPGLGQLQGRLNLALLNSQGPWLAEALDGQLQLDQPSAQLLAQLPAELRPERLLLRLQADQAPNDLRSELQGRALPLTFSLEGQGPAPFQRQGQLALANSTPWSLQWQQTRLQAKTPSLTLADLQLKRLELQLSLDGYADAQQLSLQVAGDSQLRLGQLQYADTRLQQLRASSSGLQLSLAYPADAPLDWQLQGTLSLTLDSQQQPQLKPQRWILQGRLQATGQQQRLSGKLGNAAGLALDLELQHAAARGLQLDARLAEIFLRGGNPLQQSLSAWPPLLSLNNGRLSGQASLRLASGAHLPVMAGQVEAKGLAGIYDRSELSGLDLRLQLRSDGRQLALELDELHLAEINPGLPIGPLQLKGRYQAATAQPDKGLLQIDQAHTALLGGQVLLAPGQWNLADEALLLPLEVQGVELEQLFILYPTEGLAGSGSLDGQLPLRIDASGASISQGQLSARQPGGRLQFQSERIRALGQSNPAMQLVTQSLEDFRYQVLSSQLDYDQQGKLNLAMRLEGQNPAIEQGRPIHFSINLEEDIPSLLASLQLTDKVNEVIRQRVQQRMLQRQSTLPSAP